MDTTSIFTQISLVVAVVAAVSLLMRALKQPLIMGYIITGMLVGPSFLGIIKDQDVFATYSSLGITLLLFIIGLGLNAGVIRSLGKISLITSLSVMVPLGLIGFGTSLLLGFDVKTSVVLAVALFFSSTVIILKILSDKKELSRLYGQIAIGILLIEDIIASIALVILATTTMTGSIAGLADISWLVVKALLLALFLYIAGTKLIPRLSRLFAQSQETLYLFAVAWGLIIATMFELAGLSHEVGALFAGVSLAGLPYATEMASKLKPLRDFFLVLFFVTLGETFTIATIQQYFWPAHVLALIVVLGKPLLVLSSLGFQRYTKLTSFKTALHLSQISEFSIIFVALAVSKGLVDNDLIAFIALVAFITIGLSTYLMKYDDRLYTLLAGWLRRFERRDIHETRQRMVHYPAILIGYHKGGYEFLRTFREMKKPYLVVDYDPEVIDHLEEQGVRHAYGDATDEEFLDEICADEARLVVSTITELSSNLTVLRYLRRHSEHTSFISHANNFADAQTLYQHGASYVILPHYIGSERISSYIRRHGISHHSLKAYRTKHLITIGKIALKS